MTKLEIPEDLVDWIKRGIKEFPWRNHKFPFRPIRDVAFVWPLPAPKTHGKKGIIEIPDIFREEYRKDDRKGFGILCDIGPGFYRMNGEFVETVTDPWSVVLFDNRVPFWVDAVDGNGDAQFVNICGQQDIKGVFVDV